MDRPMTIFEHLEELRRRLLVVVAGLAVTTAVAWHVVPFVLDSLLRPARAAGAKFIQLSPAEGFWVYLKLAVVTGLVLDMPLIIHQVMSFIWPALNRVERRFALFVLPSVIFLFLAGIGFSYFVFLGPMFKFLLGFTIPGVTPSLSLGNYISFALNLIIPFGITFQLPVVVAFLSAVGLLTPQWLRRNRKYAILVIFIVAAFLTPPDPLSQIVMATPMLALYEVSVLISSFFTRRHYSHRRDEPA